MFWFIETFEQKIELIALRMSSKKLKYVSNRKVSNQNYVNNNWCLKKK
jgi:hypothetical protein